MDCIVGKWRLHMHVSMNLLDLQDDTYTTTHKFNVFKEEEPSTAYVYSRCIYGTDQLKYTYVLEYVARTS